MTPAEGMIAALIAVCFADFARMAEQLQGVQGRFLLSINDRPEIRELFAWASISCEPVTSTVPSPISRSRISGTVISKVEPSMVLLSLRSEITSVSPDCDALPVVS